MKFIPTILLACFIVLTVQGKDIEDKDDCDEIKGAIWRTKGFKNKNGIKETRKTGCYINGVLRTEI